MFLLNRGELEERFDADYYFNVPQDRNFLFSLVSLKSVTENIFQGVGRNLVDNSNTKLLKVKNILGINGLDFEDIESIDEVPSSKLLKENDILSPFIGQAVRLLKFSIFPKVDERFVADNNCGVIRPNIQQILPLYLLEALRTSFCGKQINRLIGGGGVPFLGSFNAKKILVPLPPFEVQERVIELTQKAYAEKKAKEAEAREKLASVDDLVLDALGITLPEQEENTLEKRIFFTNSSEISNGRFDPEFVQYNHQFESKYPTFALKSLLKQRPQYGANEMGIERTTNDEPRYIRITDINEWGKLIEKDLGKTADIIEDKYILHNNDLLFARSGNTVGKCYLHKDNLPYQSFFAGYMIRFVLDENKVLPDYVFSFTQTRIYKDWIRAIKRTAGQPNINAEEYQTLQIPIPPPEVQTEIAERVETIYAEAKQLKKEAEETLKRAKAEVEKMILGES